MSEQSQSAAASYLSLIASRLPEIAEVRAPRTGFVFRIRKPNAFGVLLVSAELPEAAANEAAVEWAKQGVKTPEATEAVEQTAEEKLRTEQEAEIREAKKLLAARDKLIELSESPKIVFSNPNPANNEIALTQIDNEDLVYLVRWIIAGGELAVMARMFPQRTAPGPLARANGKKQRRARK